MTVTRTCSLNHPRQGHQVVSGRILIVSPPAPEKLVERGSTEASSRTAPPGPARVSIDARPQSQGSSLQLTGSAPSYPHYDPMTLSWLSSCATAQSHLHPASHALNSAPIDLLNHARGLQGRGDRDSSVLSLSVMTFRNRHLSATRRPPTGSNHWLVSSGCTGLDLTREHIDLEAQGIGHFGRILRVVVISPGKRQLA